MKKIITTILICVSTFISPVAVNARNEAPSRIEPKVRIPAELVTKKYSNPLAEFKNTPIPTVKWVMAKAQCETGTDWRNKGTYGGAFGFMHKGYETDNSGLPKNSTWGRWGGFLYAKHPSKATPTEQVIVYLRINWGGWHRPNGMFRPPSGSQDTKNQCYIYATEVAGQPKVKVRNIDTWYKAFLAVTYARAVSKQNK